jgi:AhpD family alkylhydroperoxidase
LRSALGVRVSLLNKCEYCVKHHLAGLRSAMPDTARADAMQQALETGDFESAFDARSVALLRYTDKLNVLLQEAGAHPL